MGNTFHSQTTAGVWVEDAPQVKKGAWNRIVVAQNFFAGMPAAIKVEGDAAQAGFLQIAPDNARRQGTPPGQVPNLPLPPLLEVRGDVILDQSDPNKFLTAPVGGPLVKPGAGGKPVGAPPTTE